MAFVRVFDFPANIGSRSRLASPPSRCLVWVVESERGEVPSSTFVYVSASSLLTGTLSHQRHVRVVEW